MNVLLKLNVCICFSPFQSCMENRFSKKREFPDYVLTITQRPTKYPTLIEAVIKNTKGKYPTLIEAVIKNTKGKSMALLPEI